MTTFYILHFTSKVTSDPDPNQNDMDPKHCFGQWKKKSGLDICQSRSIVFWNSYPIIFLGGRTFEFFLVGLTFLKNYWGSLLNNFSNKWNLLKQFQTFFYHICYEVVLLTIGEIIYENSLILDRVTWHM